MDGHSDQHRASFQEVTAALIAVLLAIALGWRVLDGTANFLVQGWYIPLLAVTAVALLGLAVVAGIPILAGQAGLRERPSARSALGVAIIATPVLLAIVFRPEPLGTSVLADPSTASNVAFSESARSTGGTRNVYQWAYQFQSAPPAELKGQEVDVTGFVYQPTDGSQGRFYVARFVVACCVADAIGVSLPVQWKDAGTLANDSWVQVKGTVGLDASGQPVVLAREITPVGAPSNPYIYP